MLNDKATYWVTFDSVITPRNTKEETFKYNTYTAVLSNDDFDKVSDRKEFIINGVKQKLIEWHLKRKYKNKTPKKETALLEFNDGKINAVFKNFVVHRAELDVL